MASTKTLPVELLEHIVRSCNVEDARSCALTGKILLSCSRAHIHSHVALRPDPISVFRFFDLLQRSSHLIPHFLHLSLFDLHTFSGRDTELLPSILDNLRYLKTLSIGHSRYYTGCYWDRVPEPVQSAVYRCFALKSLEAVDALFFQPSLSLLERCPKLKHLGICSPATTLKRSFEDSPTLVLQSLKLRVFDRHDTELVLGDSPEHSLLDLSQLQVLAVEYRSPDTARYVLGPWISRIATLAKSSLTELYWAVTPSEIEAQDLPVTLNMLPELRVFVAVRRRNSNLDAPLNTAMCGWIQRMLRSRTPCKPLSSSAFVLPWSHDPKPLERLIMSGVRGTQTVTFSFDYILSDVETDIGQNAFDVIQRAAVQQNAVSVTILNPSASGLYDPFDELLQNRPFMRRG